MKFQVTAVTLLSLAFVGGFSSVVRAENTPISDALTNGWQDSIYLKGGQNTPSPDFTNNDSQNSTYKTPAGAVDNTPSNDWQNSTYKTHAEPEGNSMYKTHADPGGKNDPTSNDWQNSTSKNSGDAVGQNDALGGNWSIW